MVEVGKFLRAFFRVIAKLLTKFGAEFFGSKVKKRLSLRFSGVYRMLSKVWKGKSLEIRCLYF